jgi:hypothetical protein
MQQALFAEPQFRLDALDAVLPHILAAPRDVGTVDMIVRRPRVDAREVLAEGRLDPVEGLVGDGWIRRNSSRLAYLRPHPDMQIAIMASRVVDVVAGSRERWALAGDQLFVDLDLSSENLPAGTGLAIGDARLVVTDQPHTGCKKFVSRFGADALTLVNDRERRSLRLRGIYARVVQGGTVRAGNEIRKLAG